MFRTVQNVVKIGAYAYSNDVVDRYNGFTLIVLFLVVVKL
jgi:hypothetical protein